ncbi:MAG: hypothetical protein IPM06_08715 [Rhizobiales bacterium]|nr:hypothetical protein [Hyphomicrobiales bacterium]
MNDATFNSITGAWHMEEVLLVIDDYFHMLNLELAGKPITNPSVAGCS